MDMQARFINPYTDFGFKKIFGEEASKPLLMDFLNAILPAHHQIAHLNFKNTEQLGSSDDERKAVYDIYCENEHGEKFIVELQKVKQKFFKERTLFYTTRPIQEQAEKGHWDYTLKAVYCIAILDFTFDDDEDEPQCHEVMHTVQLKNQNNKVFYDKLTFIYFEMPNFTKQEHELSNQLDKWLFFIKHLEELQHIPLIFRNNHIFDHAFETAELAKFNPHERSKYENSLKQYRDLFAVTQTAQEQGRLEGKLDVAVNLYQMGLSLQQIQQATGLSIEEIQRHLST